MKLIPNIGMGMVIPLGICRRADEYIIRFPIWIWYGENHIWSTDETVKGWYTVHLFFKFGARTVKVMR